MLTPSQWYFFMPQTKLNNLIADPSQLIDFMGSSGNFNLTDTGKLHSYAMLGLVSLSPRCLAYLALL